MSGPPAPADGGAVRRAELMAALSMATDLAMGQPMEYAMASCVAAVRLGRAAGLAEPELRDAYYEALLRYVGCNAEVAWFSSIVGDEIALRREFALVDGADDAAALALMLRAIRAANGEAGPWRLAQAMLRGLAQLPQVKSRFFPGHCEVASRLAERMGFDATFVATVGQLYARWDGKGVPAIAGDAIAPAMQVVSLAQDAVAFLRAGGIDAAIAMARERSGKAHSPRLCTLLRSRAAEILQGLDGDGPGWELVLDSEPGAPAMLEGEALDAACEAMADFTDLKSPWHLGHSRRVADAAAAGARAMGLAAGETERIRRAGWLHDIGRCGVSAGVGAQPGPMSERQWEQMRLHPYHTQRILSRPAALARVGELAAAHHERLDGSGYAKGLAGSALDASARVLIAAHRHVSLREARPHRAALDEGAAVDALMREARAGQLDERAVQAVLAGAGQARAPSRARHAAGLTEREVEVLVLLARGATLKHVARDLGLAVKTVDRHVQNIYAKIDVRTRAAATLFAVENKLLDP